MNILIIEDEKKLRDELKLFLENNGYKVSLITDFSNTLEKLKSITTDLILLDINLPYMNGEAICKEYRKNSDTPIIIITSKNTEVDELISITYGADDFVTKPYNTNILLARIDRLIKRNKNINVITYKELTLDIAKSILKKDDIIIDLTKNESKIFTFLLNNQGRIVSRDELMNYLWDTDEFIDDNTLTVNINRLRSKLDSIGYQSVITTKRGQG